MTTPLFISGIGTGVGKTIVSAILTEKLQADYWKPVQAGDLHNTDSQLVSSLISNPYSTIYPERFRLKLAASPHKAAKFQDLHISLKDFERPQTKRQLLIEGAGGLMVPLSGSLLMVDLIAHFKAETILVIRDYLGCINHSLLSFELLASRNLPIKAIIMNGSFDEDTRSYISSYFPNHIPCMDLPELMKLNREEIAAIPFSPEIFKPNTFLNLS